MNGDTINMSWCWRETSFFGVKNKGLLGEKGDNTVTPDTRNKFCTFQSSFEVFPSDQPTETNRSIFVAMIFWRTKKLRSLLLFFFFFFFSFAFLGCPLPN